VIRSTFSFPNPVNETSARLVAAGVVAMSVVYLATGSGWVLVPLAYGFVARVLAGPRFSPLGRLVTQVVTPRLRGEHRLVAGPPKRFAQGIGAVFSVGAAVAHVAGADTSAFVLVAALTGAALLESALAVCLGCIAFSWLMRLGAIPESVCADCADISRRVSTAAGQAPR